MVVLTVVMLASDANSSLRAVQSQKVAIVVSATAPATGWMILVIGASRFNAGYATQMPGMATFSNRCGEAMADVG